MMDTIIFVFALGSVFVLYKFDVTLEEYMQAWDDHVDAHEEER